MLATTRIRAWFSGITLIFALCVACEPASVQRSADSTSAGLTRNAGGGRRAGSAPARATAIATAEQAQAAFQSPVNNFGALTHKIPVPVPAGIGAMTPEIALAYSSAGSVSMSSK